MKNKHITRENRENMYSRTLREMDWDSQKKVKFTGCPSFRLMSFQTPDLLSGVRKYFSTGDRNEKAGKSDYNAPCYI
jgi:hypothetical protein